MLTPRRVTLSYRSRRIARWAGATGLMCVAALLAAACYTMDPAAGVPAPASPLPEVTPAATPQPIGTPRPAAPDVAVAPDVPAALDVPPPASPLRPRTFSGDAVHISPSLPASATGSTASRLAVPRYTYRVVSTLPHDPAAFTQGLVFKDGILYEGTGLRGRSKLSKVAADSGQVLQSIDLAAPYFGEGIALLNGRIYQLTWQEGTGFVYDEDSLALLGTWPYSTEGWGLTHDGQHLIMSDGTEVLRFIDPATMQPVRQVTVRDEAGNPLRNLNELEYINGEIFANIWQTDLIARIDPHTGALLGWIDLSGLLDPQAVSQPVDVLNGIAYDATTDRLFVTGKLWPTLFEIDLIPATASD